MGRRYPDGQIRTCADRRRRLAGHEPGVTSRPSVVVLACAAQGLIGADGLAATIALPALQDDLGAGALDAQWVISAYALAFGGTLLLAGRLGDIYGRRRVLGAGLAAFAAGSLAVAFAPGLGAAV